MRQSVELRQQLRDAIDDEIAQRTDAHQRTIARLKSSTRVIAAAAPAGAPVAIQPLVMLAHGDSWFDYPLSGNDVSLHSTDIIAQLTLLGNTNPAILNVSHLGDATTEEMSLPKQERMIQAFQDPDNWLSAGKSDAILFSGGGDDIAGNQFCIFLDFAVPGATGLSAARFQGALDGIEASFRDLFAFRDRYAAGVPIFAHNYDFAIPNGAHPICAGPWLKPSLDYCGWNVQQGTLIVRKALTAFSTMLAGLAADAANNFVLVNTQARFRPPTGPTNCILIPPASSNLPGTTCRPSVLAFQGGFSRGSTEEVWTTNRPRKRHALSPATKRFVHPLSVCAVMAGTSSSLSTLGRGGGGGGNAPKPRAGAEAGLRISSGKTPRNWSIN